MVLKIFSSFSMKGERRKIVSWIQPIEQVVIIRKLYKSRKKNLLSFSLFFFDVFNNLGAPRLLRWSPEMSTDALCLLRSKTREQCSDSHFLLLNCSSSSQCWCRPRMSTSSIFFWAGKRCRMYGENFFSVYVSRLDRWGKSSWQDASSIFCRRAWCFVVVRTSSGRDSLYASFPAGTTGIHTKTICSETKWLRRCCLLEGSAKCSSRRIRIAEQENYMCLDYQ